MLDLQQLTTLTGWTGQPVVVYTALSSVACLIESETVAMLRGRRSSIQLNLNQREKMRAAGQFNAQLMDYIRDYVKVGVTTAEIDRLVYEYTLDHGHLPAPLGYQGFPKSCCTSVNEVICHGIPGDYALQDGDLVNVDITSIVDGWHGDQSETFLIGEVSDQVRQVTQCAFDCLNLGIAACKPEGTVYAIGVAIAAEANRYGFGVVREYVGHGLGEKFHQEPSIPHHPTPGSQKVRLLPGTCFTVEPMINVGHQATILDSKDGWTVRTRDGLASAQFEHTILMTEQGPEILTRTEHGPRPGHHF